MSGIKIKFANDHQPTNAGEGAEVAASALAVLDLKVEQAQCECCGLVEECTPSYVAQIRGVYCGRWVCGLCGEAVKEQLGKAARIEAFDEGLEDALQAHMNICMDFNSSENTNLVVHLAAATRRLLRRSLDGANAMTRSRSAPNSPQRPTIPRSASCISKIPRKTCSSKSYGTLHGSSNVV